jgi:DNA anti-recombination protein RmuC
MKDNEIMECAENCVSVSPMCICCPFDEGTLTVDECMSKLLEKLVEVANRQKAELAKKDTEIDILIRKKEALRDEVSELKAEVEEWKLEQCRVLHRCSEQIIEARDEAIKEFAERLKNLTASYWLDNINKGHIDNLVKEMTEGGVQE